MKSIETSLRAGKAQGSAVAHTRSFELFARSGFIARGLIYSIVGVLAFKLALGDAGGKTTNQQGALKTIAHQPFGHTLLIAMAIGLAGYAIWRLVRAWLGHGIAVQDSTFDRVAGFASGIVYAGLCVAAISTLSGSGGKSGSTQKTTAGVLGWTGGTWIVGIAGVVFVAIGLYQAQKGLSKSFLEDSKTEQMGLREQSVITVLGVVGHLARGVVFVLVGYFLVKAAIDYNPSQAIGLDGALSKLAKNSYGPVLLGVVSAGLVAFGAYSISDARYRRI